MCEAIFDRNVMLTINNSAQKDRNVALASEKFPLPQIVVYRQLINFSSKSWLIFNKMIMRSALYSTNKLSWIFIVITAGNRHKQKSWFCKEIREDNFRFWWRRVHEYASQGMYMSKIEIFFFTARILQNQRMLCCGECFHD